MNQLSNRSFPLVPPRAELPYLISIIGIVFGWPQWKYSLTILCSAGINLFYTEWSIAQYMCTVLQTGHFRIMILVLLTARPGGKWISYLSDRMITLQPIKTLACGKPPWRSQSCHGCWVDIDFTRVNFPHEWSQPQDLFQTLTVAWRDYWVSFWQF